MWASIWEPFWCHVLNLWVSVFEMMFGRPPGGRPGPIWVAFWLQFWMSGGFKNKVRNVLAIKTVTCHGNILGIMCLPHATHPDHPFLMLWGFKLALFRHVFFGHRLKIQSLHVFFAIPAPIRDSIWHHSRFFLPSCFEI